MIIAQISDTHLLAPSSGNPRGPMRAEALRACVRDINALDPRPDAVLHTGDIVQTGSRQEYALAREILNDLEAPFYPILGNRDNRDGFLAAFGDLFTHEEADGHILYAVDTHEIRLIGIDTNGSKGPRGDFCPARAGRLQTILSWRADRPTALFMHHPPFPLAPLKKNALQYQTKAAMERLTEIVARNRQIVRLICGHAHFSASAHVAGVPASTMPSVAPDVSRERHSRETADTPDYLIHMRLADGRFASRLKAAA